MWQKIVSAVKGALKKMNIIKGISKVTDLRDIPISNIDYERMEIWKYIYSGFYEVWHTLFYHTLDGRKQRIRPSLRMAKFASQKMATLIFNEKCEINISDETLSENIQNVLKDNNFNSEFRRYLEYMFALGGMVMKVYYEDGQIKIGYVSADAFIPISWSNSTIDEAVFVSTFRRGRFFYTLLEWHIWENGVYTVKNELYKSELANEVGIFTPLAEIFADLQEVMTFPTVQRSIFVYGKPNIANNFDLLSPLGISIFANAMDTLKLLDIAYDSFQQEFVLGKKRIIVPQTAIKNVVDPETGMMTRYFDAEDEVYEAMNLGGGIDAEKIHDITVELRVEEHIAAINALLKLLAMQIGFNAGTFTFDGVGVKTATEVVSENSETFRTKQDHETNVERMIQELVQAIIEIADTFDVFPRPKEGYQVSVAFDDSIAEDKTAEINRQILLTTNGLNTKVRAIMKIFGMPELEAKALVADIAKEQTPNNVTERLDLFGVE